MEPQDESTGKPKVDVSWSEMNAFERGLVVLVIAFLSLGVVAVFMVGFWALVKLAEKLF